MTGLISIRRLVCGYGRREIVKDVSVDISPGAVWGLIGPNGSGKTTLLRCINGIIRPMSGTVCIDGMDIGRLTRKALALKVAAVPQLVEIPVPFQVLDVVLTGMNPRLSALTIPGSTHHSAAMASLDLVGAPHLACRLYTELSGGERQLVLLARALLQDTPIMLFDEPTAHLDLKNQVLVMERITAVASQKGLTVLMSIHDPSLAVRYCQKCILMRNGRVVAAGDTDTVMSATNLSTTYDLPVDIDYTLSGLPVIVPASHVTCSSMTAGRALASNNLASAAVSSARAESPSAG